MREREYHEGVVVVVVVRVMIVETLVVVQAVERVVHLVHELRGEPRVLLERHAGCERTGCAQGREGVMRHSTPNLQIDDGDLVPRTLAPAC